MVACHGAAHAGVEGVDRGAAAKMHDKEPPAGLQRPPKVQQRRVPVTEVRKAVKTQRQVIAAKARRFLAYVGDAKLSGYALRLCLCYHGRREVDGHHPARSDLFRQPAGQLAGSASHLEDRLTGHQRQEIGQLPNPLHGFIRRLAIPVPMLGKVFKEVDSRIAHGVHWFGGARGCGVTCNETIIPRTLPESKRMKPSAAYIRAPSGPVPALLGPLGVLAMLVAAFGLGCTRPAGGSAGASDAEGEPNVPAVAVSSPYLAAVATDLLGDAAPLVVLAEPGMCPGHFDLRPSLVRRAMECRLLLRMDFQQSLDARFRGSGREPPPVVAVGAAGGLCEPATYAAVSRQAADAFVAAGLLAHENADARLAGVLDRMDALSAWARGEIVAANLDGAPVLASGHQASFCRLLGLDVVGTFSAADTALPSQINEAVQRGLEDGVRLIVANLPEGRQLADALADRLGARVVVFGNFPEVDGPEAFDRLVRRNVTALIEAARP